MSNQELEQYGADPIMAKVVIVIACVIMGGTTFLTMRQSMKRQTTVQVADNPMAQSQKIMMYLAPAFGLFGLGMPIGVLIYWVTSNVWTMGQQHFLYRMPMKGTDQDGADTAKKASPNGSAKGLLGKRKESAPEPVEEPKIERRQPRKQPRAKRSGGNSRK